MGDFPMAGDYRGSFTIDPRLRLTCTIAELGAKDGLATVYAVTVTKWTSPSSSASLSVGAEVTASMEVVGGPRNADRDGSHAGLVLLYAPKFESFRPSYPLDPEKGELIIGRDATAGLCIPEAAISRKHAQIRPHNGGWNLKDLGGKNGTIVDGRFVQEVALEHLHEIRVGDAVFKFVETGAEHYARYRLDGTILGDASPRRKHRANLVGGYQMERVASAVERVARTLTTIVLLGETGTGKEVLAQIVHAASARRGALIAVNCAAVPPDLLESELFGYRRGAFSGADRDKPGLVRSAEGGTLFLDEIGELPLAAQAKLLRLLQSRELIPLGASVPERVDVRFVCATHRDLPRLVREGRLREDLFARLNEFSLVLPPLRERKEDVYLLSQTFLRRHGGEHLRLSFPFLVGLLHYDFPFNVRELEACVKRAIALCDRTELTEDFLPDSIRELMGEYSRRASTGSTSEVVKGNPPTEEALRGLLQLHHGNLSAVARELRKERMQVHRWARRFGIVIADYR